MAVCGLGDPTAARGEMIPVTVSGMVYDYEWVAFDAPPGRTGTWSHIECYGDIDVEVEIYGPDGFSNYLYLNYSTETVYFAMPQSESFDIDVYYWDYYGSGGYYYFTAYFDAAPNSPPTVSLSEDLPGEDHYERETVSFTAAASDPGGQVSRVEFYLDGIKRATDYTAPYTYAYVNAASGSHTVYAKAFDLAGASADSAPIAFDVAALEDVPGIQDRWAPDVNGDGYWEEVVDVFVDRDLSYDFNPELQGLFGSGAEYKPMVDFYEYCYIDYYYWWPSFYFGWFDGFYFPGFYYYDYGCDYYLDHIEGTLSYAGAASGELYAIQSKLGTGAPWLTEIASIAPGVLGIGAEYGFWDFVANVPIYSRLLKLGEASQIVGGPTLGDWLGTGNETLHEVETAVVGKKGDDYLVEVPYDLALHQNATGQVADGIAVVASPAGQTPSLINIEILDVEIDLGVTASGNLVVTFPTSIGLIGDFRLSIIYFVNQAGVIFQTVNPATGEYEDNYSGLKMGLWENGFDSGGSVKDDFIDLDPDRFRLKIEDAAAAGAGEIFATLEIDAGDDAYDDDPNTVRLVESSSEAGVFYSEAMLLVSDDDDDNHKAYATGPSSEGGSQPKRRTDDQDYDRTHLAQLGAMVRVEYDGETAVHAIPAKHRVTVNIVNFEGSGTSFNKIRNHWREVEERYAPLQVQVLWAYGDGDRVQPASGILVGSVDAYTNGTFNELSAMAKDIISHHGTTNTQLDCHVFYVNDLDQHAASGGSQGDALGFAVWISQPASQGSYANNLFLGSDAHILTPAHELGHLLLDGIPEAGATSSHHSSDEQNIMLPGGGSGPLFLDQSTGVEDSKRFDNWQKQRIESNLSGLLQTTANP